MRCASAASSNRSTWMAGTWTKLLSIKFVISRIESRARSKSIIVVILRKTRRSASFRSRSMSPSAVTVRMLISLPRPEHVQCLRQGGGPYGVQDDIDSLSRPVSAKRQAHRGGQKPFARMFKKLLCRFRQSLIGVIESKKSTERWNVINDANREWTDSPKHQKSQTQQDYDRVHITSMRKTRARWIFFSRWPAFYYNREAI
jgi:hypothetical protein